MKYAVEDSEDILFLWMAVQSEVGFKAFRNISDQEPHGHIREMQKIILSKNRFFGLEKPPFCNTHSLWAPLHQRLYSLYSRTTFLGREENASRDGPSSYMYSTK